jgi:hypothetical protein
MGSSSLCHFLFRGIAARLAGDIHHRSRLVDLAAARHWSDGGARTNRRRGYRMLYRSRLRHPSLPVHSAVLIPHYGYSLLVGSICHSGTGVGVARYPATTLVIRSSDRSPLDLALPSTVTRHSFDRCYFITPTPCCSTQRLTCVCSELWFRWRFTRVADTLIVRQLLRAMDWTMVNNAKSATDRIQTLFYLCHFRYEASARKAGERIAQEPPDNQLCKQTIGELRVELASPSKDLAMVRLSDTDVRAYLSELLKAFDESVKI